MGVTTVGIIGGTGLYSLDGVVDQESISLGTPFGPTSSPITLATLGDVRLAFIARHGVGHSLLPSEVRSQANIYALKSLGASWCIGVSAVGSLREDYAPGHIVVPKQVLDRTKGIRPSTFFGRGICAHIAFADPFCPTLSSVLFDASKQVAEDHGTVAHHAGCYVCMEGPQFSTRAESHSYRSLDASIIGMTLLPEAKLAREAEIAYATLALVTDYDCWRSEHSDVNVPEILATMAKNIELAKRILTTAVPQLASLRPSELASEALKYAIISDLALAPLEVKEELQPILGRYL